MSDAARTTGDEPGTMASPDDGTPAEVAGDRYLEACCEMYEHAHRGRHMEELADRLAWTLAHIAADCGVGASGDILVKFGNHVRGIVARREAEREAAREKEAGRLPH